MIIAIAAVLILAAAAFLAFRFFSNNRAFDKSMAAGESYLDEGDYSLAISAFEDALERKPKNADAALKLANAYLCAGRFGKAGELLNNMPSLDQDDERLAAWEKLTCLAWLEPEVEDVDASAFPAVTVTLRRGSDLELTPDQFTLTEDGTARKITGLEQRGRTVRLTYRSEDTDVSEEHRELELTIDVDGVTFRDDASYFTPHFEPAQLTLVSTDVSEYPRVKAFFRVSSAASGENIDGLTANSFTIQERVQGGEYLAREVSSAVPLRDHAGLNIDLVADKSDSISIVDMNKIKTVMIEFVNSLHYDVGDKAELLAFDSIVQQMCYYTDDVDLLVNGINNMSTDGMTAFYDAVYNGVTNAALQGGARCVIAFTDGMDNMSRHTAGEVVSYAKSKQVPVYIIGVSRGVEESTLRSMAQNTGGRYWYIDDLYDLQEIFDQIYSEQKELYVVEYESDASLDSYLARDLSVQVSGSGYRAKADLSFTPVRSINDNGSGHTSRYQLFKECLSWEEASRRCQEMGGHLATITSQDEMDLLIAMATDAGAKYIWLGGYTSYDDHGSVFGHWVTGEDFTYQAWAVDEPSRVDQDGTAEWYIMLWNIPSLGGWTWNDQRNDPAAVVTSMADEMAFICEFEV
ncbi:MAG: VWA domain-containing protein [Oscillospiraceae bacterium]